MGRRSPPVPFSCASGVRSSTPVPTSAAAVTSYLHQLGPLSYPVALDQTGRVADGYGVQDQPWLELVNAAGKITWQHDGWVSPSALEQAAAAHA